MCEVILVVVYGSGTGVEFDHDEKERTLKKIFGLRLISRVRNTEIRRRCEGR